MFDFGLINPTSRIAISLSDRNMHQWHSCRELTINSLISAVEYKCSRADVTREVAYSMDHIKESPDAGMYLTDTPYTMPASYSSEELRCFHILIGTLAAMINDDLPYMEPVFTIACLPPDRVHTVTYRGYPVWMYHPAPASYLLYGLRLAHAIIARGNTEKFLANFPESGKQVEELIVAMDKPALSEYIACLRGMLNISALWMGMDKSNYWGIFDDMVKYPLRTLFGPPSYNTLSYGKFNGAATWYQCIGKYECEQRKIALERGLALRS